MLKQKKKEVIMVSQDIVKIVEDIKYNYLIYSQIDVIIVLSVINVF